MRFLSLFSGIEAASSAWLPLGWECVAVSEIDPFACAVLAHHYPDVPNLGDITKITESDIAMLGDIDLVVFGSPCQDLSVAGKRKGLDGARSGLFFNAMQIVEWARIWGDCRFALWENVPGAFSSNSGADFGVVVGQMAGMECAEIPPKGWGTEGAIVGPQGMVEWAVLDAQWAGVAQRRRRVFAIADFGDWASRPPILLEPESLRGDSAPSRETGQSVAGTLASRTGAGGYPGTDEACGGHVISVGLQRSVLEPVLCAATGQAGAATGQAGAEITRGYSPTLNCNHEAPYVAYAFNSNAQPDEMRFDPLLSAALTCSQSSAVCVTGQISHTLKAEGFDASEDGTGRGTPIVPVSPFGLIGHSEYADRPAQLRAKGGDCGGGSEHLIVFDTTQITSPLNYSNPKAGDPCHPLAAQAHVPCIAFPERMSGTQCASTENLAPSMGALNPTAVAVSLRGRDGGGTAELGDEVGNCLRASGGGGDKAHVLASMAVRRLTPRECERLQAFPDDHTLITVRGKPAADGPRYKALGNSMCVNVMAWIGKQIDHVVTFY